MCVLVTQSCPLFVTPWTVARQTPLSMGFSRQEYWSGVALPSPGDLPSPRTEPRSPTVQADSLPFELPGSNGALQIFSFDRFCFLKETRGEVIGQERG